MTTRVSNNMRVPLRGYIDGLIMSTAGSSATMTIAAGQAADSTNARMMDLSSALAKTTSGWAAGSAAGGLDTGAIANSTWYHFYLIAKEDSTTDVLFSTSASAPTMPTGYTYKRRIGSGLTNGSAQWTSFVQVDNYFQWLTVVQDVSVSNPGTSAVTRTVTVPTGVRVLAHLFSTITSAGDLVIRPFLISDLSVTDELPGVSNVNVVGGITVAGTSYDGGEVQVMTNTSAQVRSRATNSSANLTVTISTRGWFDQRGKNS